MPLADLKDKENIHFELKKNKETVQIGYSKDMIFNFDFIISYVSRFFKLLKGDLIYTGCLLYTSRCV